jgi:hypothetical protein
MLLGRESQVARKPVVLILAVLRARLLSRLEHDWLLELEREEDEVDLFPLIHFYDSHFYTKHQERVGLLQLDHSFPPANTPHE